MTRIRPASAADLPAILAIEGEGFGEERFPPAVFRACLRRAGSVFLLAGDAGGAAGYVLGAIDRRYRPPLARLESLAVRRAWRRRGLGTRLLESFERAAASAGAAAVTLEVERTNSAARRLYRRAGYRREGALPNYYGPGRDALRLRKPLG